jgi:hypothetical protein
MLRRIPVQVYMREYLAIEPLVLHTGPLYPPIFDV